VPPIRSLSPALEGPLESSASGALTFLFTDIEGGADRWERHAEAMAAALALHDQLLRDAIERHRGRVFKTVGYAFYAVFGNAPDAAAAAIAIQESLAAEDFTAVNGIRVRAAIHAGSVEPRDGDYFGLPLSRTARLLAITHGGQVAVSGAAMALLSGSGRTELTLRDLGQHRLKDLTQPEHVFQLVVPGLPQNFPPLQSIDAFPNNLPEQVTSFVGREAELAELIGLLGQNRLVTLAGTGGLGKTRLSLQAAAEVMDRYPDGVWLAELAPLTEPQLVAELIAGLFGLSGAVERASADLLAGYLRQKKLMLILDNCEHLLSAAATLAGTLVRACPELTIMATSREALGILGEQVFRVPPLPVPPVEPGLTAHGAYAYPAVRLLVDRAASVLGRYQVADEDAADMARICARLDGIALAIELAAPRLRMLKPKQLLARLDDRFRLLVGGNRMALPRQQTLRALIDWSHDLLSDPEKALMRRLSVFAGGFSLDAAAAVCAGDPVEDWEVFDLLASLVDKSLVATDPTGEEIRYRLLESTRAYAAEKLAEAGEAGWARHLAVHMAERMAAAEASYGVTPTRQWIATYSADIDNLRAALDFSFGPEGDARLGLELTANSRPLWVQLHLRAEHRRRLEQAFPTLDEATPPGVAARLHLAMAMVRTGQGLRSIIEHSRQAVELGRRAAEPLFLARALTALAMALITPATMGESRILLDEAMALARPFGANRVLVAALNIRGNAALVERDSRTAQAAYEEGIELARAAAAPGAIPTMAGNLAELYREGGDLGRAIATARAAIETARLSSDLHTECVLNANLGGYLLLRGDDAEGIAAAGFALRQAPALGEDFVAAWAIQHLALAAARRGDLAVAARLQAYVDAVYAAEQTVREGTEQATSDLTLALLQAALDDGQRTRLAAEGARLTLDQAAALALGIGPDGSQ
jgi:predicted ATPase/class 3 adenylate cyclase